MRNTPNPVRDRLAARASRRRALAALLAVLLLGVGAAQSLLFSGDLEPTYPPGAVASAAFEVQLLDRELVTDGAVLFLNVVEPIGGGDVRQVGHLLFASASESPGTFHRVLSADELAAGIRTVLDFELRRDARPGDYVVVLQLFHGRNTNPHRVRVEDRLAMKAFPFTIAERGQEDGAAERR